MSWKSGSLNLLEPSGPHRACSPRDSFPPTFAVAARLRQLYNSYETFMLNLTLLEFDYRFHFLVRIGTTVIVDTLHAFFFLNSTKMF